jgi:CelD/BcsL family acetyltransferase involved in cellulose biosynthesis
MHSRPLLTTRIDSPAQLTPHLEGWRELAAGTPTRTPEWFLTWWDIYASPSDRLCVLLFQDSKEGLVGLAPLYLENFSSSKARFRLLGSGEACTNHTTWLAAAGWETRVGVEVARFLLHCKSNWNQLFLEWIDGDDAAIRATITCLAENGFHVHERPVQSCWQIPLPATWDDYLRMLSRSRRKRCRKLQREFFDSGRVRLREVENERDLEKGFEVLLQLHAARWGDSKNPHGVFSSERFLRFHRAVADKLLARNQLRLAWLECEDGPMAVEYQFVGPVSVHAYQAGVDLSMDRFSPGKLTIMAAVQFAIARGCKFLDLSRGDEPYKSNWRAAPTSCYDVRVWPDGVRGRLEHAIWSLYGLVTRVGKPLLPERLIRSGLQLVKHLRRK